MWKPIPSFPSYEATAEGQVRNKTSKKILKPGAQKSGHLLLWLRRDGVTKAVNVHTLILEAFVGPRPKGLVATHLNHNPSDNRLCNLKWDTQSNNIKASYREAGRTVTIPNVRGCRHGLAKLTDEQVLLIRELASYGNTQNLLAKDFGVSPITISRIVNRINWNHL